MSTVPAHFQLYKDNKNEWRWRLHSAGNSKIIADSGEGYSSRAACIAGIRLVSSIAPTPYIFDVAANEYVDK